MRMRGRRPAGGGESRKDADISDEHLTRIHVVSDSIHVDGPTWTVDRDQLGRHRPDPARRVHLQWTGPGRFDLGRCIGPGWLERGRSDRRPLGEQ